MKAIVLAAGMGTRLKPYTDNKPKCMLEFLGKPLLQWQIETLNTVGIDDIVVVTGYEANKIQFPNIRKYHNPAFAQTNMVQTLFCAEPELTGDVLIVYADILYEPKVLMAAINASSDVGVVVDQDYWDYWQARMDQPQDDIESLIIQSGHIRELGNTNCSLKEAQERYVGVIRFSKSGLVMLRQVYHHHHKQFYHLDTPWLRSKSFKQAYMTCMLQALVNAGNTIEPIRVNRGWLEFDNVEDYERTLQWHEEKSLDRFIRLHV